MFLPLGTGLSLLMCPASPGATPSVHAAPDGQPRSPSEENVPDEPHLPHGEDDPIEGSLAVLAGASGNFTNVTTQTVMVGLVSWELPSSESTYAQDSDFAESFRRTGMSVHLRLDGDSS